MKKIFLVAIIVAFTVMTIWFATFIPKISVDEDITKYISEGDENLEIFNKVNETFDVNNILILAVEWPEYWKEMPEISDLTEKLENLYGIKNVSSISNSISIESSEYEIIVGSIEDNYNLNSTSPEKIREIIEGDKTLLENYVSKNNDAVMFILSLYDSDEINVNNSMRGILDFMKTTNRPYYVAGNPITSYELASVSGSDTFILIPVALALIIIVLLFMFRTKTGLFVPIITVVIADIWTIGTVLATGNSMSSVLLLIPIIMIGIGVDNAIHFISRYYEERHLGLSAEDSVKQTYKDVGKPMVLACLTTAAGLMSLLTASVLPVSLLGIFGSVEIGYILLISIIFVPALLLLLKPNSKAKLDHKGESVFLKDITSFVLNHKKITVSTIIILIVIMIAQFPNLKAQVNLADFLGEESIAIVGSEYLAENFGGDEQIFLYIHGEGDDNLYRDFYYHRAMRDIQKYAESLDIISSTRSLSNTVAELSGAFGDYVNIPGSNSQMEQLFFLIQDDDSVKQIMSMKTNESRAIMTCGMNGDFNNADILVQPIKDFMNSNIIKNYIVEPLNLNDDKSVLAWKRQLSQFLAARNQSMNDEFFDEFLTLKKTDSAILFAELANEELFNKFNEFLSYYGEDEISMDEFNEYKTGKDEFGYYEEFLYQEEIPLKTEFAAVISEKHFTDLSEDDVNELASYIQDEEVPVEISPTAAGKHLQIELTGSVFITSGIQEKIVESQVNSLFIALAIILVLFILQMRSIFVAIVSIVPIVLTLFFNFGFIAGLGFSLNAATVTIASVMIGLGIDYVIHFLNRFKIELEISHDKRGAILRTAGTTGRGIFSGALTTFFSFFPLSFARAAMMGQFGLIAAFNVMIAAMMVFTLLPILLMAIPEKYFLKHKKGK